MTVIKISEFSKNSDRTNGRDAKSSPRRLAEKLFAIRLFLGLTRSEMYLKLHPGKSSADQSVISRFERGLCEPTLLEALSYARLAEVSLISLADDNLDLPAQILLADH